MDENCENCAVLANKLKVSEKVIISLRDRISVQQNEICTHKEQLKNVMEELHQADNWCFDTQEKSSLHCDQLEEQISDLKTVNETYKSQLRNVTVDRDRLKQKERMENDKIMNLENEVKDLKNQVSDLMSQVSDLKSQTTTLNNQITTLNNSFQFLLEHHISMTHSVQKRILIDEVRNKLFIRAQIEIPKSNVKETMEQNKGVLLCGTDLSEGCWQVLLKGKHFLNMVVHPEVPDWKLIKEAIEALPIDFQDRSNYFKLYDFLVSKA